MNNEVRELSMDEIEAVSGGGRINALAYGILDGAGNLADALHADKLAAVLWNAADLTGGNIRNK